MLIKKGEKEMKKIFLNKKGTKSKNWKNSYELGVLAVENPNIEIYDFDDTMYFFDAKTKILAVKDLILNRLKEFSLEWAFKNGKYCIYGNNSVFLNQILK